MNKERKILTEELIQRKISFIENDDLNVIQDKKRYNFKIIIFFVDEKYLSDNKKKVVDLKYDFQLNKLNKIIFYINDKKVEEELKFTEHFLRLKFNYIYNKDELIKEK